jgi:predicted house-cleaning noncanonical NTP pyrophosphatase (MazG superfamily)
VERLKQHCAADKVYNVNLLPALYEKVVEFYQLEHQSDLAINHILSIVRLSNANSGSNTYYS